MLRGVLLKQEKTITNWAQSTTRKVHINWSYTILQHTQNIDKDFLEISIFIDSIVISVLVVFIDPIAQSVLIVFASPCSILRIKHDVNMNSWNDSKTNACAYKSTCLAEDTHPGGCSSWGSVSCGGTRKSRSNSQQHPAYSQLSWSRSQHWSDHASSGPDGSAHVIVTINIFFLKKKFMSLKCKAQDQAIWLK